MFKSSIRKNSITNITENSLKYRKQKRETEKEQL